MNISEVEDVARELREMAQAHRQWRDSVDATPSEMAMSHQLAADYDKLASRLEHAIADDDYAPPWPNPADGM